MTIFINFLHISIVFWYVFAFLKILLRQFHIYTKAKINKKKVNFSLKFIFGIIENKIENLINFILTT